MDEPEEFVQGSDLKNANTAGSAFRPMTLTRRLSGILASSAFWAKRLRECHGSTSIIGMESRAMGTGREDMELARVRSTDTLRGGLTGHRFKPVPLKANQ